MQTISFPVTASAFPLHQGVHELLENSLRQAILIANTRGEIVFATRKARRILQTFFADTSDAVITNEIRTWLLKGDTSKPFVVRHPTEGEIEIHNFLFSQTGNLSFTQSTIEQFAYGTLQTWFGHCLEDRRNGPRSR